MGHSRARVSGAQKAVPGGHLKRPKAQGPRQSRPSIASWRDQSAGASRRRVTPIPRGNLPSIAARTISGARKARDMVMLTCRTLQRSRLAMLSALEFASTRSSSSQRRPRAIDATKVARVSDERAETAQRRAGVSRGAALVEPSAKGLSLGHQRTAPVSTVGDQAG